MRRALFLLILFAASAACAQKVKTVSATYTFYAPETMTVEEAKHTAIERARLQAIADEFGTLVAATTATHVINDGDASRVNMHSTGLNEVAGEWIETIGTPTCDISWHDGMLVVKASVSGKARELRRARIPIVARVLRNGTEPRFESHDFRSGDDLFLSFQAPVDGNLLIYLVDYAAETAYCLLPYSNSPEPARKIERDTPYIFFSEAHAPANEKPYVDEYNLTISNADPVNLNDIVVIFSPDALVKGNTTRSAESLPRELPLAEFERWRAALKVQSPDTQITNTSISITQ